MTRSSCGVLTALSIAVCMGVVSAMPFARRLDAESVRQGSSPSTKMLRVDDTIGALVHHPAFADFGRLLLPWDDRQYDEGMRLRDIGELLPYHSHVDPAGVVAALNRLITDAEAGKRIFYDLYSEEEKRLDPSRRHTGLFFMRGRVDAPFAIVAPGGGFAYVGSVHEGFPYAAEISARGYNAFVLKYRAGHGGEIATDDLAAAIAYVMQHASTLGVSTESYSLWGSSAGARMAASIGSHGAAAYGAARLPKPSAVVMAYTGHADVAVDEPPTFVVVGDRDAIAPPSTMERRIDRLRRAGTRVEYHKYPGVGHGFGLGVGTSAEGWVVKAIQFWTTSIQSEGGRDRRSREDR